VDFRMMGFWVTMPPVKLALLRALNSSISALLTVGCMSAL
jgi:hypothetical protein